MHLHTRFLHLSVILKLIYKLLLIQLCLISCCWLCYLQIVEMYFRIRIQVDLLIFNFIVLQLNANVNTFQRQFVSEIRRCEEMERQLSKFSLSYIAVLCVVYSKQQIRITLTHERCAKIATVTVIINNYILFICTIVNHDELTIETALNKFT